MHRCDKIKVEVVRRKYYWPVFYRNLTAGKVLVHHKNICNLAAVIYLLKKINNRSTMRPHKGWIESCG